MRLPLLSMFLTSPFSDLQGHAKKVKECAWVFQQAIECYVSRQCRTFEKFRQEVATLEREADAIKRRIRGHIPIGTLMPVDKFQLFLYLRQQDNVLDSVEDALDWLSYRPEPGIPEVVEKDVFLLVDSVIEPIEDLEKLVIAARQYFKDYSEEQRVVVKNIIHGLRKNEHEADILEHALKKKTFESISDPVTIFHIIRLAEIIGSVADHAENAGDMMRGMIAK